MFDSLNVMNIQMVMIMIVNIFLLGSLFSLDMFFELVYACLFDLVVCF